MSRQTTAVLIAGVLVIIGGLLFYKAHSNSSSLSSSDQNQTQLGSSNVSNAPSIATESAVIMIGANGFSPSQVTIKVGGSVTWKNVDSEIHQVNSNPHPTHTDYPPLNTIGQLNPGQEKSLTFPAAGTHGFHDHLNPNFTGKVVVVP